MDQVAEAAAETVELPHDERIAALKDFQAAGEGRAVYTRARHLVLEHLRASRLLQGGDLHGRILVLGADARVAVSHALHGTDFRDSQALVFLEVFFRPVTYRLTDSRRPDVCYEHNLTVTASTPR